LPIDISSTPRWNWKVTTELLPLSKYFCSMLSAALFEGIILSFCQYSNITCAFHKMHCDQLRFRYCQFNSVYWFFGIFWVHAFFVMPSLSAFIVALLKIKIYCARRLRFIISSASNSFIPAKKFELGWLEMIQSYTHLEIVF